MDGEASIAESTRLVNRILSVHATQAPEGSVNILSHF
jgi:hypothetical protein